MPSWPMLQTLRDLFVAVVPLADQADVAAPEHTVQLAAAVLLVEVMRADATLDDGERDTVLAALRTQFGLTDDEAQGLHERAHDSARTSTDLYGFTSLIDTRFEMADKLRMVEAMWRVAYADGHLAAHERHMLWRIADLLHVPAAAYHHARQRA